MLNLRVTHSLHKQLVGEKRVSPDMSVDRLKELLYPVTGTSPSNMRLWLDGSVLEGHGTLAQLGLQKDSVVHVQDMCPRANALAGIQAEGPKYVMSDEKYDALPNSMRKFLEKHRVSKEPEAEEEPLEDLPSVGERCQANGSEIHRGEIAFVGSVEGKTGIWVGIRLDEPVGKNDGSVGGKRYFDAPGAQYGLFCRPNDVQTGEFPPLEEASEDEL